jgi:hypothetical protein
VRIFCSCQILDWQNGVPQMHHTSHVTMCLAHSGSQFLLHLFLSTLGNYSHAGKNPTCWENITDLVALNPMYEPSTCIYLPLVATYYPRTYQQTYFLHDRLPRWNPTSTQLGFIHPQLCCNRLSMDDVRFVATGSLEYVRPGWFRV